MADEKTPEIAASGLASEIAETIAASPPSPTEDHDLDQIMSEIEALQGRMEDPIPAPAEDSLISELDKVLSIPPVSVPEPVAQVAHQVAVPQVEVAAPKEILTPSATAPEEPWLQETYAEMAQLKDSEKSSSSPLLKAVSQEPQEFEEEFEQTEGSLLEMTLSGEITVKLKHGKSGQDVTLRFYSDCLQIQLSDGMEFKIPSKRKDFRKAA